MLKNVRKAPATLINWESNMLSWVKQQRKLLNAGKLKAERLESFQKLLDIWEENKRINQYQ